MTPDATVLRSAATIAWVPLLVVGALVAATGGVVLAAPDATVTLLTVMIALWLLVTGLGRATPQANRHPRVPGLMPGEPKVWLRVGQGGVVR